MRVLVVDDDQTLAELMTAILQGEGYRVEVASNGQEAFNFAKSLPDLILLDIRMPIMDGWTCWGLLRTDPETINIPVIVMSADSVEPSTRTKLGVKHFLAKPFELDDLLNKVNGLLHNQQSTANMLEC